ncbi:TetM/TetW/TetO/TetS family tetracycline resistance ribosomal protection protein [Lachnospiraceae bacterium ZAX-1]
MKKIVIGIVAHVDAGKTTLSESILYLSQSIRKLGRVDYGNAFFDMYELERARGITIFSKQAVLTIDDLEVTILDTPGHVDFSAEMERTLQVFDYAILVINGADGVQGHTETLWKLLSRYKIPVFLFVNKMDQNKCSKEELLDELKKRLGDGCLDFNGDPGVDLNHKAFIESVALCDETLLERYLETDTIEEDDIRKLIASRKVFPCYFGSALKLFGVEELLQGIKQYTKIPKFLEEFGGKVYKIARDEQGNRLTYLKITGGSLKVKALLTNRSEHRAGNETDIWEEKVNQIRIYSGTRYEAVNEVQAGAICAVTGLSRTYPGEGLGVAETSKLPMLKPVLTYQMLLPPDCNVHSTLLKLRQLEEEDPQLHIIWEEQLNEIHVRLMGEVQTEILKSIILERFDIVVEFGEGNILYKETILNPVEGIGHFEPLRHYAEVHLLLEPLEAGSGLVFASACREDVLDKNWQKLILTHLEEKEHKGVLTGSVITDIKFTLIVGQANRKHTEGGDFREATYRAIRQGLKKAESVLLEPYYEFRLEVPFEMVGRALSDMQKIHATFLSPKREEEAAVITGTAPVILMNTYHTEVISYTRGQGKLFCTLKGYEPCHNADEVIEKIGYDSERDLDNPTGSVFCVHGAGIAISWEQVEAYMHVDSGLELDKTKAEIGIGIGMEGKESAKTSRTKASGFQQEDKELEEIFNRTYGEKKQGSMISHKRVSAKEPEQEMDSYREETQKEDKQETRKEDKQETRKEFMQEFRKEDKQESQQVQYEDEYLLVDGYNIIFDWVDLKELAEINIEAARNKLMDILCNYQAFKTCILILVFDAYRVEGHTCEVLHYNNIHVVYTKEAETADLYIEKVVHEIGRKYHATVATSDRLEQVIVRGRGANLLSARGLKEEVEQADREMKEEYLKEGKHSRNYLFNHMSDEMAGYMEDVRLGKKEIK